MCTSFSLPLCVTCSRSVSVVLARYSVTALVRVYAVWMSVRGICVVTCSGYDVLLSSSSPPALLIVCISRAVLGSAMLMLDVALASAVAENRSRDVIRVKELRSFAAVGTPGAGWAISNRPLYLKWAL